MNSTGADQALESDPRTHDRCVRRRKGGKGGTRTLSNGGSRRTKKTDKCSDNEGDGSVPRSRGTEASILTARHGETELELFPDSASTECVTVPASSGPESKKADAPRNDAEHHALPTSSEGRRSFPRSSVMIVVTERIREFLRQYLPEDEKHQRLRSDRIDLDDLLFLVQNVNKHKQCANRVDMAHLVEGSFVIERKEAPPRRIDHLPFSEQLRIQAEERRHQAAVKSLWGDKSDRADCFADLNRSLGMGINAIAGLFLTFLGGYWGSLYCGISSFQNRVLIGMVLSIICMLVEVCLFAIHDAKQQKMMEKERKHTFAPNFNSS